jgi:lipopolysaccharide transport system permease protein
VSADGRTITLGVRELWEYRELAYFLAWRDFAVRYKQTALGIAWVVAQPLLLTVIFTLIFGVVAKVPSAGIPYPIFAFAGLVPWQLFAHTVSEASLSIVANERLISKVYFPRLIIPLASSLGGIVDVGVSSVLLVILALAFGAPLMPTMVLAPLFIALALVTAAGVGLWLAALNVQFRDVRYTLPFLTQVWMFATPILYPPSLVPQPWAVLVWLNPMTSVVEGFRWAVLGTSAPSAPMLGLSIGVASLTLLTGALYFKTVERRFADIV